MSTSDHPLPESLHLLHTRWMLGTGSAAPLPPLPEPWTTLCESLPEVSREAAIASIATQYHQVVTRPVAPENLEIAPLFPVPDLPLLAGSNRVLFRRAIANAPELAPSIADLLWQHHWALHPMDWLPAPDAEYLPDYLVAWQDWRSAFNHGEISDTVLTEDSWADFYPAHRLRLLRHMRRNDPASASQLIATCSKTETAEKRVPIVSCLAVNLSEADEPFLTSLLNSRSQREKEVAARLLQSIGRGVPTSNPEAISELVQQLECTRSLRKKTTTLRAKKQKNKTQQRQIIKAVSQIAIGDLAEALKLTIDQFIAAWEPGDFNLDQALLERFVHTTSGSHLSAFLSRIAPGMGEHACWVLGETRPHMTPDESKTFAQGEPSKSPLWLSFKTALSFAGPLFESLDKKFLTKTPAWKSLEETVKKHTKEETTATETSLTIELLSLGCLAPASLTPWILTKLTQWGLPPSSPPCDTLRLNPPTDERNTP